MTIEYLGEKIFLDEVADAGRVWVARGAHKNICAQELDPGGWSLPVWSDRERVASYLKNARLIGPQYEPEAVSLDVFTRTWLSNRALAISELQINPDGKSSRVLVLTAAEFIASQSLS